MKLFTRFFPSLLVALFAVSTGFAQIGIGFHGGFLSSNQTGKLIQNGNEVELETESVTGYVIGIPIEFGLSNILALQTEVNFLSRGYLQEEIPGFIPETKVNYNVVEVPVLAKIGWTSENFSIAAVVGPSFQYLASGKIKTEALTGDFITIPATETKIDFDDEANDDLNRTNFYGQAGVQLGVPFAGGKFVVDGRYRFALNDENSSDDFEVKGRGISATVGYIHTFGDY